MKKYIYINLIPISSILVISIILSLFNLLNVGVHPMIYIILMILIMYIYGYLTSKNSNERGYIKGLLAGFLYSLFFFLLTLIFN